MAAYIITSKYPKFVLTVKGGLDDVLETSSRQVIKIYLEAVKKKGDTVTTERGGTTEINEFLQQKPAF
jgi:hypothetical protein